MVGGWVRQPELRRCLVAITQIGRSSNGEDSAFWMRERGFEVLPGQCPSRSSPSHRGIPSARHANICSCHPGPAILSRTGGGGDRQPADRGPRHSAPRHVHRRAAAAGSSQKYAQLWGISTEHFDPYASQRGHSRPSSRAPAERDPGRALDVQPLTPQGASVPRGAPRTPQCSLCGQDETWHGRRHGVDSRSHQRRLGTTTGSRTCGSCARTAQRRSTRIADGSCRSTARTASAFTAGSLSGPSTRATAIARPPAAAGGTGPRHRPPGAAARRSGRRSTSCSR